MSIRKIILASILLFVGCAVNRVENVNTKDDADSLYKVPVVYGIGVVKDSSLPVVQTAAFAEYDPETKEGTSSCLGSADIISLSLGTHSQPMPKDHQLHYYVKMVPPGYYGLTVDSTLYEAKPSLYIKIEKNTPQYLGDFWFARYKPNIEKGYYSRSIASPVEYHMDAAMKALQAFDISTENLKQVPLIPIDKGPLGLLCTP